MGVGEERGCFANFILWEGVKRKVREDEEEEGDEKGVNEL